MQDAVDQDSIFSWAIEDDMAAMLKAAQARTDLFAGSSQAGVIGEGLEARFEFAEVFNGLRLAPGSKGECNDGRQVGFGAARKAKARHGSGFGLGKLQVFPDSRQHVATGNAA